MSISSRFNNNVTTSSRRRRQRANELEKRRSDDDEDEEREHDGTDGELLLVLRVRVDVDYTALVDVRGELFRLRVANALRGAVLGLLWSKMIKMDDLR